jgi:hypothetical protein
MWSAVANVRDLDEEKIRLTFKYEAQAALFKDPVRTAL